MKWRTWRRTPARPLEHEWFGLSYINVVKQEKMVAACSRPSSGASWSSSS